MLIKRVYEVDPLSCPAFRRHLREWFTPDEAIYNWIETHCRDRIKRIDFTSEKTRFLLFQNNITGDVGIIEWRGYDPDVAVEETRQEHFRKDGPAFDFIGETSIQDKNEIPGSGARFGFSPPSPNTDRTVNERSRFFWRWSFADDVLMKWMEVYCPGNLLKLRHPHWIVALYAPSLFNSQRYMTHDYVGFRRTISENLKREKEISMRQFSQRDRVHVWSMPVFRVSPDSTDIRSQFGTSHTYEPKDIVPYKYRHEWTWFKVTGGLLEWLEANGQDEIQNEEPWACLRDRHVLPPPVELNFFNERCVGFSDNECIRLICAVGAIVSASTI